jgi:hypothetical protein
LRTKNGLLLLRILTNHPLPKCNSETG